MSRIKFVVLIFLSKILFAENYRIAWMDTIDNGNEDRATGVAVDKFGNIVATGYSKINNYDYFTVKYDSRGNILWADTFDNGQDDKAYDVAVDTLGNIIVTGASLINGDYDYFTIKYDPSGNILWADTFDNGDEDKAQRIIVDNLGNIIITGYSKIGGDYDWFTIKYNPLGDILWADTFDYGGDEKPTSVVMDTFGNILVTGDIGRLHQWCILIIKYNTQGDTLFSEVIVAEEDSEYVYWSEATCVDIYNNIIFAGTRVLGTGTDFRWVIIKYDPLFNKLWRKEIDEGLEDVLRDITTDGSSIVGVGWSCFSYTPPQADFVIIKFDSTGNIIWADTLDITPSDAPSSVSVDKDGNIVIAGAIYSYTADFFIVKYTSVEGVEEKEYKRKNLIYQIEPNPSSSFVYIRYYIPIDVEEIQLKIYDICGNIVKTITKKDVKKGEYLIKWDGKNDKGEYVKNGIYFCKLHSKNIEAVRKIIFIH